jgi:uncharacterized membrane-anchored protein
MKRVIVAAAMIAGLFSALAYPQTQSTQADSTTNADSNQQAMEDLRAKLRALDWVKGPTTVPIAGNSKLAIPEHYVFLDAANTAKFEKIVQNLGGGTEVLVAPDTLRWAAYLVFTGGGYVKDDDKIDAPALLTTLKKNTEDSNAERRRLGYQTIHIQGWASLPAYNTTTKRLEWATLLTADGAGEGPAANFYTKILGRRGHTSVVMVSSPDDLPTAEASLDSLLNGYSFNSGDTYAEYRTGDKVAEYGLAALIVGGAAAVAAKKGLFGVIATFLAAAWKFLVAGVVAAIAWLRQKFGSKKA